MDIYFMFQKRMNKKKLKRILMIIFHYMGNLKEKLEEHMEGTI